MTQAPPLSPPPHPVWMRLAHGVWWFLIGMWLLLALLWGSLHFLIVPRIAELRPWVQTQVSQRLGLEVRIDALQAQSNGWVPSVALSGVRLLDAQGQQALHLPSVLATFSLRSLLHAGFEQLYVEAPVLDVRRSADGRIWVAGLAISSDTQTHSQGLDWLLAQGELVVRHGTLTWTDVERAPLVLNAVDIVLRKRRYTHTLRIDATPPPQWGARFQFMGAFKEPLFNPQHQDWRTWKGQLYAHLPSVDVAQLRQALPTDVAMDFDVRHGSGALRAWMELEHGKIRGVTADVALRDLALSTTASPEPLDFRHITGRLGLNTLDGGHEYFTEALAFDTADGLHWPGGNLRLQRFEAKPHGALFADRLDLAAVHAIARRWPLGEALHAQLDQAAPKGLVEKLQATWQGPLQQPQDVHAQGRISGLSLEPLEAPGLSLPGVKGLTVDFDGSPQQGQATLALHNGALVLPQIYGPQPLLFSALGANVRWKHVDEHISLSVNDVAFSNADAEGEARLEWQSTPGASGAQRFPGVLDVQGTLKRAQISAVARYLPSAIPQPVRDYLQNALLAGTASNVQFKVNGDLAHFPFVDPKQGEFAVTADLAQASYAYLPASLQPKDSAPWPMLTQLEGRLALERDRLTLQVAESGIGAGLQLGKSQATVTHLYDPDLLNVAVDVQAKGPLAAGLGIVNTSPVGGWINKVLANASASGNVDYKLKLQLPPFAPEKAQVQGSVAFAGNELQITPDVPRLQRLRGSLAFSESGFSLSGVQARSLGGDVRIDGGLSTATGTSTNPTRAPSTLRLQGNASAEGVRQAKELGALARLGEYAQGGTAYSATLGLRNGVLELSVNTTLTGLALTLPAPFSKAAETNLPVRFDITALRPPTGNATAARAAAAPALQDQLHLEIGRLASATYQRDISGPQPRVLRGNVLVGPVTNGAPMPAEGVAAQVNSSALNVDDWVAVVTKVIGDTPVAASSSSGTATTPSTAQAYVPNSIVLQAQELVLQGRTLNQVLVGAGRQGGLWRANLEATQLNGYVEYRQSNGNMPGRVYARLLRLNIGPSAEQDMQELLDQQPSSIPTLDIVVDELELRGKKLGRLEIQAVNVASTATTRETVREAAREWRLNRLSLSVPEASLSAEGSWTYSTAKSSTTSAAAANTRPRTALNFKLDIANSGDLLQRLGMPGVIAKGKGKIEGQVAWRGSPITLDYPSMGGGFHVDIASGQFLKADPGIAKLLGVLSLQSLPRRLMLDFRDVFSDGFAFDFVRGDVAIEQGMARTNNLQMKGVNAAVMMEGQADLAKETQAIKAVIVPEINAGSASLLASTINPLVGLTTFLAQVILRQPLIEANTVELFIDGTWSDPRVNKVERKPP